MHDPPKVIFLSFYLYYTAVEIQKEMYVRAAENPGGAEYCKYVL